MVSWTSKGDEARVQHGHARGCSKAFDGAEVDIVEPSSSFPYKWVSDYKAVSSVKRSPQTAVYFDTTPAYDANGATALSASFCNLAHCFRLRRWAVTMKRVPHVDRAIEVLSALPDRSVPYVVLAGHGTKYALEWGTTKVRTSSDGVPSPELKRLAAALAQKINPTPPGGTPGTVYLLACSLAEGDPPNFLTTFAALLPHIEVIASKRPIADVEYHPLDSSCIPRIRETSKDDPFFYQYPLCAAVPKSMMCLGPCGEPCQRKDGLVSLKGTSTISNSLEACSVGSA